MNIGRFVKAFEAYDAKGVRVPAEQVSVNQWRLSAPARVRTIRYTVTETWDSPLDHPIYKMCGTSIEADHVLINPHAVIGYPEGLQAAPVRLRLAYPAAWTVGTALHRGPDGVFVADSYDQLVDSPILLGRLTKARLVGDRCADRRLRLLRDRQDQGAPAARRHERHAERRRPIPGQAAGGPLHLPLPLRPNRARARGSTRSARSTCSRRASSPTRVGHRVTDIAAHEFFHIVTPLNIHSEIIEHFNFVTPVPSQHLWLYEGTTEWAAHAMQLRAGLKTPEDYLQTQIRKMQIDRQAFDSTYSLRELALTSYSDSGQAQYGNIYMRGALTAGLLDIRLLELSHGRAGPAGPDRRADPPLREAAGVPRLDLRRYAGGDDLSRRSATSSTATCGTRSTCRSRSTTPSWASR